MATVQNVNEQQGSNWVIPTAVGGAVGAGAGYFMAPAKYSSLDALVKDAKDVFEGEKAMKEPTEEAPKKAFNTIKDAVVAEQKKMADVDKLFENNAKPAREASVLEGLGIKFSEGATKENVKVAQEVAKLAEGQDVVLTDELAKLANASKNDKGEITKGLLEGLADVSVNNDGENAGKLMIKVSKEQLAKAKEIGSESNVKLAEFLGKEGEVTADELKGMVKKDFAEDVKKAFEENKKMFGKNRTIGLIVGVAGGLVVGWLASKFFGGKEA